MFIKTKRAKTNGHTGGRLNLISRCVVAWFVTGCLGAGHAVQSSRSTFGGGKGKCYGPLTQTRFLGEKMTVHVSSTHGRWGHGSQLVSPIGNPSVSSSTMRCRCTINRHQLGGVGIFKRSQEVLAADDLIVATESEHNKQHLFSSEQKVVASFPWSTVTPYSLSVCLVFSQQHLLGPKCLAQV